MRHNKIYYFHVYLRFHKIRTEQQHEDKLSKMEDRKDKYDNIVRTTVFLRISEEM